MANLVDTLTMLAGSKLDYVQKFILTPQTTHILLVLPGDAKFGILRDNMTKPLETLLRKSPTIQVEALGVTGQLCEQIGRATKPDEALVQVNINIYGPPRHRDEVGDVLSGQKLWLQRPDHVRSQFPYSQESNPHAITFPELQGEMVEDEVPKEMSTTSKPNAERQRLEEFIQDIQDSTKDRENVLENEAGDQRLKTELLGSVTSKCVKLGATSTNNS